MTRFFFPTLAGLALLTCLVADPALAQNMAAGIPAFNVASGADGGSTYSLSLQILALMTGLTVLPSLVLNKIQLCPRTRTHSHHHVR